MARKTYVPSLMYAANKLCNLIARATPLITRLYGTNANLMAALQAANTACAALHTELEAVRDYGD